MQKPGDSPPPGREALAPSTIAGWFAPERAALIPMLTEMQRVYGYLSDDCLAAAAGHAALGMEEIRNAVTFYPHLRFTPPARHLVRLCQGTACHVRGAPALRESVEAQLGIATGSVTPDGLFALEPAACLGCCSLAPVLAVGATVYGHMDAARVREVLGWFRAPA